MPKKIVWNKTANKSEFNTDNPIFDEEPTLSSQKESDTETKPKCQSKKIRTFIDLSEADLRLVDIILIDEIKKGSIGRPTRASVIRYLVNLGLQQVLSLKPEIFKE
jgi:hypothetical protein